MKSRSREINIFSMSALDLFASALGAFILIAVALFPYFPNTGDSEERVAEVKARLEAVIKEVEEKLEAAGKEIEKKETELKEAEDELKRAEDELKRIKFPHLDLVIALDITGSMRGEIEGLKNEVEQLAEILLKLAPSLGIGVIAFGDRDYDEPTTKFNIRAIQTPSDLTDLKNFTSTLSPRIGIGGGKNDDDPEAINLAMQDGAAMPWRGDSEKKIIVIVTDNTVYPEEEDHTLSQAESFAARSANNIVSTVHVRGGGASKTQSFLEDLADAGRGQYVKGGGSMTANILRGLL